MARTRQSSRSVSPSMNKVKSEGGSGLYIQNLIRFTRLHPVFSLFTGREASSAAILFKWVIAPLSSPNSGISGTEQKLSWIINQPEISRSYISVTKITSWWMTSALILIYFSCLFLSLYMQNENELGERTVCLPLRLVSCQIEGFWRQSGSISLPPPSSLYWWDIIRATITFSQVLGSLWRQRCPS